MLVLNLRRLFELRGISYPFSFLTNNGFDRAAAERLLNQTASNIKIKHITMLCMLLNCTPDELFEWKPADGKEMIAENHSLKKLERPAASVNFKQMLRNAPIEKLYEMQKTLEELNKDE